MIPQQRIHRANCIALHVIFLNSARDWGGAENWSVETCTGLAERGHSVTVVCHPDSELRARLREKKKVEVEPVRIRAELDPLCVARLAAVFRRTSPDALLAYRTKDVKLSVAANWLAGGIPLLHAHKAPHPLRDSAVYRFLWSRGVKALAVPSRTMRALLLERDPWLANKPVVVIPNGVDTSRYRPRPELREELRRELGLPSGVFVISYHGRIEPRKNVDLLIRGVAQAGATMPVHAIVIGDGAQTDELRRLAATLKAPVTFAGFRVDIPRLLSAPDAAAHLSTAEGLPNSVLEAMACGLPVIATAATSHAEQIEDGKHGYLVRPDRPAEVAEAIVALARSPADCRRMGEAAAKRAVREFSRQSMIDGYERFLSEHARAHL